MLSINFLTVISIIAVSGSSFCGLKAQTNVINPTIIGEFALTEDVSKDTKIYIKSSEISFVKSTGRTIYSESYSGPTFPIVDPDDLMGRFDDIGIKEIGNSGTTKYRYYYIASPNGFSKITDILTLDNTLDSFLIMLNYVQDLAIEYYGSKSLHNINNIVMGYIRSFNSNYLDYLWLTVAGKKSTGFKNFVSNKAYDRGLTPYEYFGAFVSKSQYDESGHYLRRDEYNFSNLFLIDPLNNSNQIDLIHMIASLDGNYFYTGHIDSLVLQLFDIFPERKVLFDLSSWAGDMQQAIYNLHNTYGSSAYSRISSFADVLNGDYGFDKKDLIADLDAYNIGANYLDYSIIYDAISSYYSDLLSNQYNRYSGFVQNLKTDWTSNGCLSSNSAKERIFDYAMLSINKNCEIKDVYYNSIADTFKYAILFNDIYNQTSGGANISYQLRYNVANSFYEYLVEMGTE